MEKNNEQIFDSYAAAALQALISKLPIQDRDGEFSSNKTQQEIHDLHNDIARSAFGYAWHMMKNRKEYLESVSELLSK